MDPTKLSVAELKKYLKDNKVDFSDCIEKKDLINRLKSSLGTIKIVGIDALRVQSKTILLEATKMEYEVTYESRRSLGISLERSNEWGIVKVAPPEVEVGSVLTRVNGDSVLLKTYAEAMQCLKHATWPLTMRFRKAVSKEGYLLKRARGRTGSAKNWKRRYVVLANGILEYYTKAPSEGGVAKGQYVLENDPGSQTMVTMAPAAIMSKDEVGIMLVKGDDRLVLKGETFEELITWGGMLYYAVAMANGGNPEMCDMENQRLAHEESELATLKWEAESAKLRKEQQDREAKIASDADTEHRTQMEAEEKQRQAEEEAKLKKEQEEQAAALAKEQAEAEAKRVSEQEAAEAVKQAEEQRLAKEAEDKAVKDQQAAEEAAAAAANDTVAVADKEAATVKANVDAEQKRKAEEESAAQEKAAQAEAMRLASEQADAQAVAAAEQKVKEAHEAHEKKEAEAKAAEEAAAAAARDDSSDEEDDPATPRVQTKEEVLKDYKEVQKRTSVVPGNMAAIAAAAAAEEEAESSTAASPEPIKEEEEPVASGATIKLASGKDFTYTADVDWFNM